jgi:hypothetical protein
MPEQNRLDETSGLFQQNMLVVLLEHEISRSQRYPCPISLLYFAMCFTQDPSPEIMESAKLVVAYVLQAKFRESDLPGQYEGNYMVVMPATDEEGARVAAGRLMEQFRRKQFTHTAIPFDLSVCVGVSSHPGGESMTVAQMLSDAVLALREAQQRGPNSLVVLPGSPSNTA